MPQTPIGHRRGARRAARSALVFVLTFCLVFWAQGAAFAAQAGTQDTQAIAVAASGSSDASSSSSSAAQTPGIEDLQIYQMDADGNWPANALADAVQYGRTGQTGQTQLSERGGTINFGSRVYWSDDSVDDNYYVVEWSLVEGSDIATISSKGQFKANGTQNGTAVVQARVAASETAGGSDLVARATVTVVGQEDTPYVSSIQICDADGNAIDSYTFPDDTALATAYTTFTARVTVTDPSAGTQEEYLSAPGRGLSAQTSGTIPDLIWSVNDPDLATVDASSGMYRPLQASADELRCVSNAGPDGTQVMTTIQVTMPGTEEQQDGYFPQDSLHITVTYEEYPDKVVADRTFTVDDLAAMPCATVTYTAIQGGASASGPGFYTVTGYGPYLSTILAAVGVDDTDSVQAFEVKSYDSPDYISGALLFDSDRWYYPNYDMGSTTGAIASPPMLALEASRAPTGSAEPSYDYSDGNRFWLLFGAKQDGSNNAQHQRKWVNAIHVIIKGAPPADDSTTPTDQPDTPNSTDDGSGAGGAGSVDDGTGSGGGGASTAGLAAGGAANATDGQGNATTSADANGSSTGDADGASAAADTSGAAGDADAGAASGRHWSIYEMASPYDDNSLADLYETNPIAPFVIPFLCAALAAGFVDYCARYARQRRKPQGLTWANDAN